MGKDWSILIGALMIILSFGASNSQMAEESDEGSKPKDTKTEAPAAAAAPLPVQPKTPQCYGFFPGTPGWNDCFQKYMQDMADYQMKMHEYLHPAVVGEGAEEEGSTATAGESIRYENSNAQSMSSSLVGGYAIKAMNMPVSSSVNRRILKVNLFTGPVDTDTFVRKDNEKKNQVSISLKSKGLPKWVKIAVPKDVDMKKVHVERSEDSIFITGPVNTNGDNFQYAHSSFNSEGSFGNSGNINQAVGQMPPMMPLHFMPPFPEMPAFPPMPDLSHMFQGIFGGPGHAALPARKHKDHAQIGGVGNQFPFYAPPLMWFY